MRYVMKQRLFSLGGAFNIKTEGGEDVFTVEGRPFSFGHQLTLTDIEGNELAYIKQRVLSWGPTYEIYRGGQLFAVVRKELFSFFRHVFTVDVPGPVFPYLHGFKQKATGPNTLEYKVGEIFGEIKNKISSGYNLREIIEQIDVLRFRSQTEKHELSRRRGHQEHVPLEHGQRFGEPVKDAA